MYMYGVRAAVFKSERERERERMSDTNGRGAEQQSRRCEPDTNGSEKETGEQKGERERERYGRNGSPVRCETQSGGCDHYRQSVSLFTCTSTGTVR